MYRSGKDYDLTAQLVINIYLDYNIKDFPVDAFTVCRKLGIKLIPYSSFDEEHQFLLCKRSPDAFYSPPTHNTPPKIFYNDSVTPYERLRYNIFHEVKHYVNGDTEDNEFNDDMAEYFARYFMCPIPYLIAMGVDDEWTIISDYGVSHTAATNTLKNLRNRRKRYSDTIFDYEQPLIDLLCNISV